MAKTKRTVTDQGKNPMGRAARERRERMNANAAGKKPRSETLKRLRGRVRRIRNELEKKDEPAFGGPRCDEHGEWTPAFRAYLDEVDAHTTKVQALDHLQKLAQAYLDRYADADADADAEPEPEPEDADADAEAEAELWTAVATPWGAISVTGHRRTGDDYVFVIEVEEPEDVELTITFNTPVTLTVNDLRARCQKAEDDAEAQANTELKLMDQALEAVRVWNRHDLLDLCDAREQHRLSVFGAAPFDIAEGLLETDSPKFDQLWYFLQSLCGAICDYTYWNARPDVDTETDDEA